MFDNDKTINRKRRQERVRDRVRGTDARPRLCVFRSAKHIYVQVISDEAGKTLVSASTMSGELKNASLGTSANPAAPDQRERTSVTKAKKVDAAKKVGALVAKRCLENSISQVVFDRNGFLYHGRIRALADAAREAGLKF
ncbi:MAG TPA: 50S ribosomal protein L18 [Candidatus Binatia bacterium]|nr:50S ribosomal protein L18 [Candidatus Binatia bacterium]